MLSIIILTRNEANDLPACLESLRWCDDLHIVDSGSTDQTIPIARAAGAKVSTHGFESFGRQRNWALDCCDLRHEWVLFLDADEQASPEFVAAMRKAINEVAPNVSGFYCCWKLMLEDRWLRRCDSFPRWQFRLLRRGAARFCDFGHGQKESDIVGRIEYLRTPYLHFAFSKGWTKWVERHNRYSSQEALARLNSTYRFADLFRETGTHRMAVLKTLAVRLPGWPFSRFCYSYFFKFGFLEGSRGFIYCVNIGYYEFLIKIKMRELKARDARNGGEEVVAPTESN
jgi:glycosyltransferase involved in cell wall biosynthesis